jgi:hypothetical protein
MGRRTRFSTLVGITLVAALAAPAIARAASSDDQQIAEQGLFTADSVPAGWTQKPHTDSPPTNLPPCRATEAGVKKNRKYRVESPDFEQGGTTQAHNTIYAFPTTKQAKAFVKLYKGSGVPNCFKAIVKKSFPKAEVTVEPLPASALPNTDLADDSFGFVLKLKDAGASDQDAIYFSALAYRTGRFFDGFTFQNLGSPLPETDSLVADSLQRLTGAIPSG